MMGDYVVFIFAGVLCLLILGFSFFIYKREVLILDLRHENKVLNDRVEGFHKLECERWQEYNKFKTHPIGEIYKNEEFEFKEILSQKFHGISGAERVRMRRLLDGTPYSLAHQREGVTPDEWQIVGYFDKSLGWQFKDQLY